MARSADLERDPATVFRQVAISEETRNDLEAFAAVIAREGYRINAGMLRRIAALWDAGAEVNVDEREAA